MWPRMGVRETSIETYHRIVDSGLLSRRRMEVYSGLYQHGPCTINELYRKIGGSKMNVQANLHARMNELRELGVVAETRTRPCEVTGERVIEWQTTDSLPRIAAKPTKIKCTACGGRGYIEQGRLL